jgi:hypothetical protein
MSHVVDVLRLIAFKPFAFLYEEQMHGLHHPITIDALFLFCATELHRDFSQSFTKLRRCVSFNFVAAARCDTL